MRNLSEQTGRAEELIEGGRRRVRRKFSETAGKKYEEIICAAEMVGHLLHIQKLRAASGCSDKPASDYEVWSFPDLQARYLEHWNAAKTLASGSSRLQDIFDSLQRMSGKPGDLPEITFSWEEMSSILVRALRSYCARIARLNRRSNS